MNNFPSDYHLHTKFSGDCNVPMHQMIEKAIQCNMKSMCLTDHLDFDYPFDENLFLLDGDSYYKEASKYKQIYQNQIDIRIGVETGIEPDKAKLLDEFIEKHDYDFIIGSSHLVHKMDPYYPEYFKGRTEQAAFLEYFESIIENLQTCHNFDVYGHLDYVVRYAPNKSLNYHYSDYTDIIDIILKQLISSGKGIELNTAGYRKGMNAPNPSIDILKRYHEIGGEIITIGSDAHFSEDIGSDFLKAVELLKVCGFRFYTTFLKRRPEFHSL